MIKCQPIRNVTTRTSNGANLAKKQPLFKGSPFCRNRVLNENKVSNDYYLERKIPEGLSTIATLNYFA